MRSFIASVALLASTALAAPLYLSETPALALVEASSSALTLDHAATAPRLVRETKHYEPIFPGAKLLSHEEYLEDSVENNAVYQGKVRAIHKKYEEEQMAATLEYDGDMELYQSASNALVEQANYAFTTACTAKVINDLEDINAYHRYQVKNTLEKFQSAMQSPNRHTINLIELRQARHNALEAKIYDDKEILMTAEEECSGDLFDHVEWDEATIDAELEKLAEWF